MAWRIGLSPWVIQDGNYGNFRVGEQIDMAVECGISGPVTATTAQPSATYAGEDEDSQPTYAICADVVHRPSTAGWHGVHSPTWWQWRKITQEVVLDCGPFRVFADGYAASMIPEDVERFAAPQATFEIDSFTYFERLAAVPGFPPLIYTWTLDAILLAHPTTTGGPFTNVDQTDAWNEADGHYLLECTLLDVPPKHRKTIRIGF